MPLVAFYLGRPAHVWIAAMSRRGPARKADNGSGVVRVGIPARPEPIEPEAAHPGAAHHGAGLVSAAARHAAAGV
jgi:hypothetical protein